MNRTRRRRKAFNLKKLRLIYVPIVIFILISIFLNRRTISNIKTTKAIKNEYLDKTDSKGYLILKEKTYTSQGNGVVDYTVRDGERVPKNFVVANLNLMNDVTELKNELLKVQSAIEYKNQSLNPSNNSFVITEKEINLINSIQDSLVKDKLEDVLIAIDTLELNTKKNVDISEISDLINLSNQELEDRRDDLSKEISTNNIVYKSENAGIVSYKVDKLEDVYTEENIPKIDYKFMTEHKESKFTGQKNTVKLGDPLFKLIDNFSYHIAIPIDRIDRINSYAKGEFIDVLINSKISLRGEIVAINKSKINGVIILKLTDKLSELGYDRIHDISIVNSKKVCYVIPTKSVAELNNKLGVYVLELNGIVKFRPIEILNQNELDTLISVGDDKGNIDIGKNKFEKTITSFDEIIDDPANIEEGQILK